MNHFTYKVMTEKDIALVQKDNVIAGQKEEIIRLKQQLEERKNK